MVERFGDNLGSLGVRAIITHSENSSPTERASIATAFSCPVFDEYSSEECYLIATQGSCGRYHVVEDSVRLDVLAQNDRDAGPLIATSLVDNIFPLIKYEQRDIGRICDTGACDCGSSFRILESFQGRADQRLALTNGATLSGDRLMAAYDDLLPGAAGIVEFRITQDRPGYATLLVVSTDRRSSESTVTHCQNEIRRAAGGMIDIEVRYVDEIPPLPGGKRRLIISTAT